tara:strand:- start:907 stop:1143 length:237 start_codon:yes stop_codon:yes gene_type:complete
METKIITLDELATIHDGLTHAKRAVAGSAVIFTGDHPQYGTVTLVQCDDQAVMVYDGVPFLEPGHAPTAEPDFIEEAA